MAGISGAAGGLTIGANTYPITAWEITPRCELLEDSNSKSSGLETYVAGFTGGTGSFTAYYDESDNPMSVIQPGDSVTLILKLSGSKSLNVPAIISDLPISIPIKGKVEFTCNFTATGWQMASSISGLA
jgi:hypothetical protein